MEIVRFTGLKAWAFLAAVLIGGIIALLFFLGLLVLLLPVIILATIFLVLCYLFYQRKGRKKRGKRDIDVKFKVKREEK